MTRAAWLGRTRRTATPSKNVPPFDPAVQNPVTYLDRGVAGTGAGVSAADKAHAHPLDIFLPETGATKIDASDTTNAQKLAGLGYTAEPSTAWPQGQFISIEDETDHTVSYKFYWDGAAWQPGVAPDPLDITATALPGQSFANKTALSADGTYGDGNYSGPTFSTGQYVLIGGRRYYYDATTSAWVLGTAS